MNIRLSEDLVRALNDSYRAHQMQTEPFFHAAAMCAMDKLFGVPCICGAGHLPRSGCYVMRETPGA